MQTAAGALAALSSGTLASTPLRLPRAEELETGRLLDEVGLAHLASAMSLGRSAGGRPIDLISVGNGDRSALIVGAPHPNEPIGCLTVLRLLSRLAKDAVLREQSGWRWHVIPAIDVDGLQLNDGWLRGPLSIASYCRWFYRPPFALQPEYAFPLKVGAYEFTAATPENVCWQRALSETRPQLQCSLHGCDSGGTFFLCSEERPALFERLLRLPDRFAMPLNPVGEPFSDMDPFRPGIVAFPAIAEMLHKATESGSDPAETWDAGDSSAGYAAQRWGTFSMACEVPLWDDPRLHRTGASPYSAADTLRAQAEQAREDHALLEASARLLEAPADEPLAAALAASLREARAATARQGAQLEALALAQTSQKRLSWLELVQYEPGTAGWRTPAMLARLARLRRARADERRAADLLRRRVAPSAVLRPVSLEVSSGLQLAAIAAAAGLGA